MRLPDGSNREERSGAYDIFIWGVIIGGVIAAAGWGSFAVLTVLDQVVEVESGYRAAAAATGVFGLFVFGASVILMRFIPPPNPY